jgi:hypothetical protein
MSLSLPAGCAALPPAQVAPINKDAHNEWQEHAHLQRRNGIDPKPGAGSKHDARSKWQEHGMLHLCQHLYQQGSYRGQAR